MRDGLKALLLLALLAPVGCARPEVPLEQRPRLLLLPANFDYKTPDAMIRGLEVVVDAMERHATEEGLVCLRIDLDSVVEHWEPSIREVGGLVADDGSFDPARLEAARGELVRRLVADHPAEGGLLPTIELKRARYNSKGTRAVWDDVSRPPRLVGSSKTFKRRDLSFRGTVPVTSLWGSLYDPAGQLLESRRGGLELVQRMEVRERKQEVHRDVYYYEWVDRDDLFRDSSIVEHAVELVMDPILEVMPRKR